MKVNAYIDREVAAHPELVQIENGYRSPKEQRPGAAQRGQFREIETAVQNPDAETVLSCAATKTAIIVYGKRAGTTLTVCTDSNCFFGGGGANTLSASVRKSNSPSRGMPTCPASARRRAKRVSSSSAVVSMVESSTSSALRCSFSLSPATSSARSSAKV